MAGGNSITLFPLCIMLLIVNIVLFTYIWYQENVFTSVLMFMDDFKNFEKTSFMVVLCSLIFKIKF